MAAVPIRMSGIMLIDFAGSTATRTNEIGQAMNGICRVQAVTIRFKAENVFDIALINHVDRV